LARKPTSKLVYQGAALRIEFYVATSGDVPVLCFFMLGKRLVLTHGFSKKGDKTPKGEIERAEEIKKDFLMREEQ